MDSLQIEKRKRRKKNDYLKYKKGYDLSVLTDTERKILSKRIEFAEMTQKEFSSFIGKSETAVNASLCRTAAKLDGRYDKREIYDKHNEYMKENKDKKKGYNNKYYRENKEKVRKQHKEYYEKNKERIMEKQRARREEKNNKIKEWRKTAGLTQQQFSELFDPPIPIDTIKKWDSGKMKPADWVEGLIIEKLKRMKEGDV